MGSIQQQLQIYHIGAIVCIILLILSALTAILLFFLFDIPTIFMIRSGRMKKLSLQKTTENNSRTDPLRSGPDMDYTTADMGASREKDISKGSDDTTLLDTYDKTDELLTAEVLAPQSEYSDTVELSLGSSAEKNSENEQGAGGFKLIEEIVVIHTKESI